VEQLLTLLLAFGPFVVLGIVVVVRRRQDARESAQDRTAGLQSDPQADPQAGAQGDPQAGAQGDPQAGAQRER
jgi:hypothetical protein